MKIRFMGTAAAEGFPAVFCKCENCMKARELGGKNIRATTCTMIDDNILIDFGPDILTHVHNHRLNLTDLDAIVITHSHEDHFYMGDLNLARSPFGYFERGRDIMVCGNHRIHGMFEAGIAKDNAYSFLEAKPFVPFKIEEYTIHPMLAEHGDEDEQCLLYAIERGGKTFLAGNDTNIFPDETWQYLEGLKINVAALDATIGINPAKPPGQSGHMNIKTVNEVKERMIEIGCADNDTVFIMNHFSHNGGLMHHEFEALGAGMGLIPAYDGYVLDI